LEASVWGWVAGGSGADGARGVLFAVFTLSLVEKGATLWRRSAAWHPVMLVSPRRRRHATALMAAGLVADLATTVLLVVLPEAGAVSAVALVLAYTVLALPALSGGSGTCRCLWKLLEAKTAVAFLCRNAVLVALAGAVAATRPSEIGAGGLGYGAGLLLALGALVAGLDGLVRREPTARTARGSRRAGPRRALGLDERVYGAPPHREGGMP
jgi:hypothetical protein